KVGTNIISKETESIDGDTTTTTTYATDGTAPITLVTTVTQMPYNAPFGGQPASISHPDGTLTTFTYTPVSGGGKSVTGTTGVRPGSTFTLGKSTTSTYNRYGVVTGEAVSDIASAVLLSSRASLDTDLYGRVTKWAYFNDPDDYSETIYGCCGLEYERARDGTVTNYFRDARERINTSTVTLGIAATGFVPRTTITGYTYGANDGLPEETVSVSVNGTAAGATTTVRDLVGRTVSVTSPGPDGAAETTRYAYPGNGLTTTMTNADGGTVVTESHPDGQTKSVSDNAAIRMDYAYDSHDEGGGGLVTSVTTAQGVSGVHTTYTNLAGRVFKVVATAPHGGSATTFTTYNAKGQAEVVTSSGQPAVKYIYDDLGDRVATWTDRNSDEEFNNTADEETGIRDSWTGGITDYLPADNAPSGLGDCRRTRAWVRLDTNPGTDVPVSTTYQSIDGLRSLSESIGVDGATTTGSNRPLNGAWTSTTTYPDLTSTISATTLLTGGVQQTVTTRYTSEQQPATVEATTILTDPLGRTASTTSGRGHVTNYIYHPNGGQLDTVTQINAGPDESDLVTSYAYALTPLTGDQGAETATRTLTTTLPDATSQYRTTNILGQTLCQWGSQTTPVAFAYDAAGRRHTQTTYRAAVGASADTFPTITGDTTTWNHDPSGVLLEKIYPGGKKTAYTYYVSGRLHTRTWERPISATDATKVEAQYAYFTSGQLSTVTYNDGTANLAHTQDRLGRTTTIIQENQSELAYSYADGTGGDLGIDTETITYTLPGRAPFTRVLDRFDRSLGRDTGWDLKQPGTGGLVENTAIHTYSDTTGRLDTILGASAGTFTYGYVSGSDLIDTVTKAGSGGAPDLRPTRTYETNRDVLASVSNDVRTPNGNGFDTVTRSAYDYTTVNGGTNKLGQRGGVAATFNLNGTPASANSSWGHDSLGQVTSAANSGDTTFNRAYQFDTIGNRVEARDGVTSTTGTPNYSSDARNQYLSVPFVPAGPSYDDDGNMTSGPLKVGADILPAALVWDAENRPIQITLTSTTTKTVINRFDPLGRLISRTEGTDPETDPTTIYLYDGWNRIAEYTVTTDTANPPVTSYTLARTYLWGLDLSGALQGAGGVGGLLAVRIHTGGTGVEGFYYPTYDGNGNISEYLKPDGTVAAHFEYDPFGNTVVPSEASTGLAANFAYRFSTKPLDLTTGLYYYGYRWLDPLTGRWPSRDPIGERGGVNLYGFVANDGVSKFDILGKTESISEMKEGPCCCKVGGVLTTKVSAEQIGKCIKVKAVIFKTYFHLSWNPLKGFGTYYTYQKDVVAPGDLPSEHGRNDHSLSIAIDYSWSADGDCPCVSKIASDECTSVPIMAEHKYTFSDGSTASSTPHANLGYEKFFILTRSHGYRLVNNFDEGGIVSFPITRFEVNNTSGAAKLDVSVEAESKQIYHGIFTFKEGSNIPEDE
ncbi:MAG: hypothetical protein K9M97_03695, partial [Akkermansiaceae bacterium]|nr:hypothetical protein [Akkermansiaceae bacterium]